MRSPTPEERAHRCNPIIGDSPVDTLYNAACVASFLARLQSDRADASPPGPDPFDADETRGLYFVTEALAAALRFELDRRPSGQEAP